MKDVYKCRMKNNYLTITIHRKPSQIPAHIDMFLLKASGWANCDGPNNVVQYDFSSFKKLLEAEAYLHMHGWKKN